MMVREFRLAVPDDIPFLSSLDEVARSDIKRCHFIREAVLSDSVWVIEVSEYLIGFGVISHRFFGRSFIDLVYIEKSQRNSGHGSSLLLFLESKSQSNDLFTSTNESNTQMQYLLQKHGYENSGIIHNLDPGDPELVFTKRVF